MEREERKALMIRAPSDADTGVANDFGERLFTVGTTHAADAMPTGWAGRWIELLASVNAWFAFSTSSSAEVDRTVAAAGSGGDGLKLGRQLIAGTPQTMRLPDVAAGQRLYFVREAAGSGNIQLSLTDYLQVSQI